MSMRRIASVALALCLGVVVAYAQQSGPSPVPSPKPIVAASLTGTWTGTFKPTDGGSGREETAMLVLKQEGDVVTGTAGPGADQQMAIAKGKISTTKDGTAVTFDVVADSGTIGFNLKLVDGHLKGSANAERDGQKRTADVDLTRAK